MYVRIQFFPDSTIMSDRPNSMSPWKEILKGDSYNITSMARRTLQSLQDSHDDILVEYCQDNNSEEYVFMKYLPPNDDPKIIGMSQYAFAKFCEVSGIVNV